MGNCLVTTLKGTVDNGSLKKVGEGVIFVNSVISVSGKFTARADGNKLYTNTDSTPRSSITFDNTPQTIIKLYATEPTNVFINNWYGGSSFSVPGIHRILGGNYSCDFGYNTSMNYMENPISGTAAAATIVLPKNIVTISGKYNVTLKDHIYERLTQMAIIGRLDRVYSVSELIAKFPNIQQLELINVSTAISGVFGDFGSLASLTKITGGLDEGSLEDFVAKARTAGKETGSVAVRVKAGVTFNGSSAASESNKTLSWTASTITFDGTTIDA